MIGRERGYLTLDRSHATVVVCCALCDWRHLTRTSAAAWEAAAEHEVAAHPERQNGRQGREKARARQNRRRIT